MRNSRRNWVPDTNWAYVCHNGWVFYGDSSKRFTLISSSVFEILQLGYKIIRRIRSLQLIRPNHFGIHQDKNFKRPTIEKGICFNKKSEVGKSPDCTCHTTRPLTALMTQQLLDFYTILLSNIQMIPSDYNTCFCNLSLIVNYTFNRFYCSFK